MSLKMEFAEKASKPRANVSALCREYGISRDTGHKWLRRFHELGHDGLEEQSRRPASSPLATAEDVVMEILQTREAHPRWGAKTMVVLLKRKLGKQTPSVSTIARVLTRFGKIRQRRKRPAMCLSESKTRVHADRPNEVWTVDFKGWWRTRDGERCDPLTVRDAFSRFVLATHLVEDCSVENVKAVFAALFRRHGVPSEIHCDNGVPFISVQARGGLTRLSAWWVSLGIRVSRSRLASPQDNGAHERMHVDLKADVQAYPQPNRRVQQRACDRWRQEFNHVRPHAALDGKTPAELYRSGPRRPLIPAPFVYPASHYVRRASPTGMFKLEDHSYRASRSLAGQVIALEPVDALHCRLWFRELDLGLVTIAPPKRWLDAVAAEFVKAPFKKRTTKQTEVNRAA